MAAAVSAAQTAADLAEKAQARTIRHGGVGYRIMNARLCRLWPQRAPKSWQRPLNAQRCSRNSPDGAASIRWCTTALIIVAFYICSRAEALDAIAGAAEATRHVQQETSRALQASEAAKARAVAEAAAAVAAAGETKRRAAIDVRTPD
jgi:hypothetical protein